MLYFYPQDDTETCTAEAIDFSGLKPDFEKAGAVVIGVSPDSPKKHDKFKAKYGLAMRLAADEAREAIDAYGVWGEKTMFGRKYMGVERSTFLIDRDGKIARIWRKVKVQGPRPGGAGGGAGAVTLDVRNHCRAAAFTSRRRLDAGETS